VYFLTPYTEQPIATFLRKNQTKTFNGRRDSVVIKKPNMLWTIVVILLILWLLGLISGYRMGGFVHILLVIAIVVVLIRVFQGRRPV